MSKSLREQLLGAGLVDKKKAKKAELDTRKARKEQLKSKVVTETSAQKAARKAKEKKQARDRKLNQERQQAADKKALAAQVNQLISHYRLPRKDAEVDYNFTDGNKIKKILVTSTMPKELARGRLCIARVGDRYEVIPKPIADKISERDPLATFITTEESAETDTTLSEDDEYYAQFKIPDDLMW